MQPALPEGRGTWFLSLNHGVTIESSFIPTATVFNRLALRFLTRRLQPRGDGGHGRSQANTAKVLEGNPTLMRLRELEVLERVATSGKLNVVLGEEGLADRVVNLL